jgi:hypothetical protein
MKYIILNFVLNFKEVISAYFLNSIKKRTMVNFNGDLIRIYGAEMFLPNSSLHELFVDRVVIAPNAIALEHNDESYLPTIAPKANQMAHYFGPKVYVLTKLLRFH